MAGIKISALPPVSAALLTDFFPVVQGGITSQETLQQVLTLFNANIQLAAYTQVTGLGTAATKTASGSGSTVASISGSITTGHFAVFSDTNGTISDGGSTPGGYLPLSGGTMTGSVIFSTGTGIQTNTTAGNTMLLQAYNTNTAAYVTFATLTANNPPTMDLNTTTTIGGAYIFRAGGSLIPLSVGGTFANLTASNGGIVWSNSTQLQILAGTATANLPLLSGSTATPSWGAFALSLGGAFTSSGAVTFSGAFATTITVTAGTTVTLPTTGTLLSTAGGQTVTGGMTINGGLTLGTALAVASGGTAKTSVTTAPAASSWAGWDANSNLSANNFLPGFATTATAAGTTTLTVASAYSQFFTGSTTQTVLMPVVSTLALGQPYYIFNSSSGNVTVQSSGGNNIQVMAPGTSLYLTVISTSGTTAASWNAEYAFNGGSGSGTVNSGTAGQLAYYAGSGTAVSGGQLGNILGTATNDSASTGYVGEFVTANEAGGGVSLTAATAANVKTISLTAGDWDVWGNVCFTSAATEAYYQCWISTTSATQPADASNYNTIQGSPSQFAAIGMNVPSLRLSLSGTTTVYLSARSAVTGTTVGGNISARRVR